MSELWQKEPNTCWRVLVSATMSYFHINTAYNVRGRAYHPDLQDGEFAYFGIQLIIKRTLPPVPSWSTVWIIIIWIIIVLIIFLKNMVGFSGPGSWGIIFLTTIIDWWTVVAGLHYCLILIIGTTSILVWATAAFTFVTVISWCSIIFASHVLFSWISPFNSGRRWEDGAKDAGGWRWGGGGVLGTKKVIKVGEWWWRWWGRTSSNFLFVVLHVTNQGR